MGRGRGRGKGNDDDATAAAEREWIPSDALLGLHTNVLRGFVVAGDVEHAREVERGLPWSGWGIGAARGRQRMWVWGCRGESLSEESVFVPVVSLGLSSGLAFVLATVSWVQSIIRTYYYYVTLRGSSELN
jgi:hypothetical protein